MNPVLSDVVRAVLDLPGGRYRRVAIDGVDGAGKTHFANALAKELILRGSSVVRASADGFYNPPRTRHRRGQSSPEGFYRDSFDYGSLIRLLLDPFGPDGSGSYISEVYDWQRERNITRQPQLAPPEAILVLDGIFLHRDELVQFWDYTVWLDVPFEVAIPRGASPRGYYDSDPKSPGNRRYIEGQRLYFTECNPRARASVVIDNTDVGNPAIAVNSD